MLTPDDNLYQNTFEGIGEYIGFLKDDKTWDDSQYGLSSLTGRAEFAGSDSYDTCLDLAITGWPEGLKNLTKELDGMKGITATGRYKDQAHDVAGYLPDVPRAIAGQPDCMFSFGEEIIRAKPVVKIMVNIGGSSRIDKSTFLRRGAAILSYIDQLEQNGQRVELSCYFQCEQASKGVLMMLNLKQAGEPIDLDRMSMVFVHVGFFRRLGFRYIETCPWPKDFSSGYGTPRNLTRSQLDSLGVTVHLSAPNRNYTSSEAAITAVTKELENQLNQGLEEAA